MHLEFLVEEPSMEAVLVNLLPKILAPDVSFAIRVFQGKQDLLKNLPDRLRAYKKWIPANYRIVILIDRDNEDCYRLKKELDKIAQEAQLIPKSSVSRFDSFQVMNRIVIEELESWFFGDRYAIRCAYPALSPNFVRKPRVIRPDDISDPCEKLERVLQRAKYYPSGIPKIEVARNISRCMDPDRNCSHSFWVFREGLLAILSGN